MTNPITMFEIDRLAEEFGVALNENDSISQQEPRQHINVSRDAHKIGRVTSDGFLFTNEELRQKLEKLLYNK